MKLLLVEDDENKRGQILALCRARYAAVEVSEARSFQSALSLLKRQHFNVVLLDMTLPNFDLSRDEDGGMIHPKGGEELLRRMKRLKIITPVIVVTQFDTFGTGSTKTDLGTLRTSLLHDHPGICREVIYYNSSVDVWKRQLSSAIDEILMSGA